MRIERLFNVLVLGGAALSAGCDQQPADDPVPATGGTAGGTQQQEGNGAGSTGGASTVPSGAAGEPSAGEATTTEAAGSGGTEQVAEAGGSSGAGSGGETSGGTSGASGAGGSESAPLVCSESPNPGDACGCPCCWIGGCMNDEPCCESFCAVGNNGNGCCGT